MEVPGQRETKDKNIKPCSFCEDYDITTYADGFCVECEVNICNSCFVKHKGRKSNRNHSLVSVDDSSSIKVMVGDTYETCQEHDGEFVKFYCPKHDQVGCGECGVLNHKRCGLEFIRDKVAAFSTSQNSRDIIQDITGCKKEAEDSALLLVINRQQMAEFYEQFVRDVEAFADHVIERIQIMKSSVLKQAKEVMLNDKKKMDDLQKQTDDLIAELSRQNNMLESKINQPNKFFVASLQVKSYLKKTKRNVDIVKKKNIVTQYKFKRDEKLAESIKESNVIGSLIELSENIQQHQDEFRQTNPADNRQVQDPLPQVQDPLPQASRYKNFHLKNSL
ncbi:E3 ubiquitin-protein ligase TRIM33-like [Ruditapes philippinarum]|uniref:E3 ubiquitin-protein ligase TRIM33-like n=1 Tax=Ruditapes philippinarum TaxID=129788 RepID=UPI00295AC1F1|nr:E3 ubiquitin-protein ligase TRIM33-like [Ruditapes philippinarum]